MVWRVTDMNIVILDGFTANSGDLSWDAFSTLGSLTVYERSTPREALERSKDAHAILTNKVEITDEIMRSSPNLSYIGVLATGYNVVDIESAKKHNICVTNIPSYSTHSVAQFTFALLLEVAHHVGHHSSEVHKGRWISSLDFCFADFPLIELHGKTMGIIGYGNIGREVGKIAMAFGMKVLAYHPKKIGEKIGLHSRYVSIADLYRESDVISIHTPLQENTYEMINAQSIKKMKDGVILINTSRGKIINETDLREALISKKISYAALDVISEEPMKPHHPLFGLENAIITPHIAWAPIEARKRLIEIAYKNLEQFTLATPLNVVS